MLSKGPSRRTNMIITSWTYVRRTTKSKCPQVNLSQEYQNWIEQEGYHEPYLFSSLPSIIDCDSKEGFVSAKVLVVYSCLMVFQFCVMYHEIIAIQMPIAYQAVSKCRYTLQS